MARLFFFGKLGDVAGSNERDVDLPSGVKTVADLIKVLGSNDPGLEEALTHVSVRYVINEEITHNNAPITNDDEIAFLPPVSGG